MKALLKEVEEKLIELDESDVQYARKKETLEKLLQSLTICVCKKEMLETALKYLMGS
jgi:hypothetical protein